MGSDKEIQGIRLSVINWALALIAVFIALVLTLTTNATINGYNDMRASTDKYLTCQQSATSFEQGSDYLTAECRYFVTTGDVVHAQNYMNEVLIFRRRDIALEQIEEYLHEHSSYDHLSKALEYSDTLVGTELYAMKLAAVAYQVSDADLPQEIAQTELTAAHLALPASEQQAMAVDMLFGEYYEDMKANIYTSVQSTIDSLLDAVEAEQRTSADRLSALLNRQLVLVITLIIMLVAVVLGVHFLITRPLEKGVHAIQSQQKMRTDGSREMRFLANIYNEMFDRNMATNQALSYSATHDSLTGVHNRTAYDAMCRTIDQSDICAMIVDVDKFKDYNDTYGHDVGDKVLQKVAKVLTDSFRHEDFISRIGGDEFSVIMMNAHSDIAELALNKVRRANELLSNPTDGLPTITISVGIAFGDRQRPHGDIFKDADTALYHVKEHGRASCAVYTGLEENA